MEDPFCDQSQAYQSASTARDEPQAVTLYEQFKEAILAVEETLADDENLLVLYHSAGEPIEVQHLGYYGQTLLVLRGRSGDGLECTAVVPANSLQLVIKKVKKLPTDQSVAFDFMGYSVVPDPSAKPSG